ncbi:MAG: sterol desaturase family protein [Myxococcota bacterium]
MDFDHAKMVITGVLLVFAFIEVLAGRFFHRQQTTMKDVVLEVVSSFGIPLVLVPLILEVAPFIGEALVPNSEGWLAGLPWWAMVIGLLIGDDLTQYWWHRLSHTSWLYPLHRAHHSARYMSVRLVYRNNLVYYLLMPGVWVSALLVYWGFGTVYAFYIIAKLTVIISAHSSVPWDDALYRWPVTRPFMWVIERVFSTPSTHSAHHGLHESDGVTHYKGNYGNFLFLWDVLFGTAKITRGRPTEFGIEGLEPVGLFHELLWPAPVRKTESPAAVEAPAAK